MFRGNATWKICRTSRPKNYHTLSHVDVFGPFAGRGLSMAWLCGWLLFQLVLAEELCESERFSLIQKPKGGAQPLAAQVGLGFYSFQ